MEKNGIIQIQFKAIILTSFDRLGKEFISVKNIEDGPAKKSLSNWEKARNTNDKNATLSGIFSDLAESGALRVVGKQGSTPDYGKGENFNIELEQVLEDLFQHVDTSYCGDALELSINPEKIYIDVRTIHDLFIEYGIDKRNQFN